MTMSEPIDPEDIQGLVASGYDHLNCTRFLFLEIIDADLARAWLKRVMRLVTNAVHPGRNKSNTCFNLAFSWKGLQQLGIDENLVDGFSREFRCGMTRPEAAKILGDLNNNEERNWDFGRSAGQPLHILAMLYGKTPQDLEDLARRCELDPRPDGFEKAPRIDSVREPHDRNEPFGFRDGISQPPIVGFSTDLNDGELIKTGEFLLGYENELGFRTSIASIDSWQDPAGYLADDPARPSRRWFALNGTYLVFRKLSQDVSGFWRWAEERAGGDPNKKETVAAKLVGRWRSGAPLVLNPHEPGADPRNDFLYTPTDPAGTACPIGSHIRRANPRDSLPMWPSRSLEVVKRHRIIRRGRPYRDAGGQGICFIALNADLMRQFEFVQQIWFNDPEFNGLDHDPDPLVGLRADDAQFTIQCKRGNQHLRGLPDFVRMKGGGYFFLPGIRTIRFLANLRPSEHVAQSAAAPPGQQSNPESER